VPTGPSQRARQHTIPGPGRPGTSTTDLGPPDERQQKRPTARRSLRETLGLDGRGPAGPYGTVMTPGWNGDVSTMPPQALISAVMEIVVFEPGTDTVIFGAGVQVGSLADGVGTQ